jgi:DNA-binding SARP family transcriptional activator
MMRFEVRLLGPLQLALDGRALTGFESNKVRALLAYLAVEGARAHSREHLAALLWPEQPDRVARQNLRQALYALRQTLDPLDPPVLLVDAQSVQWNPASDSWRDIDAFRRLLDESRHHAHPDRDTCAWNAPRSSKKR